MGIDRRKNYYMVLDTETCNGIVVNDKLDLSQSLVYDIGFQIIDKKGTVYTAASFAIYEIFCGMRDVMNSAYYVDKLPKYWEDIKAGTRKLVKFATARKAVLEAMKKYNVVAVIAHNAGFDTRALNNTERYLTKSKYRFFFPYNTIIWDSLKMATDTICKQKSYINFCLENDFMTKHKTPRVRATAEILYKYISGEYDFVEEHQGLDDVIIESQIFVHCLKQHKKMRKALY